MEYHGAIIMILNTPVICYSVPHGTYMMCSVHEVFVIQEKSTGRC